MSADSFADDEKRAELNRLFSHWRFKRAPIARPLLRHLADLTLEHPEGQGWKGKDVIESLSDDVTAQGDPAIYFSRLRTLLVRHYTAERKLGRKAEGEICVTVPMVEDTRKGYHVDFEPFPGPYETDPVLGFWRQVGYGFPAAQRRLQPSPINILFSNERPERGQHELDERGAASGSGEVVAAVRVGPLPRSGRARSGDVAVARGEDESSHVYSERSDFRRQQPGHVAAPRPRGGDQLE